MYRYLHAVPAAIWSCLMPLQHIDAFRKRWPLLHRFNGYMTASGSLLFSITGSWLLAKKVTHSHENIFHLHRFPGQIPVVWPTFDLATWSLNFPYLVSLFYTIKTARAKQFQRHRQWAVFHSGVAYLISVERLLLVSSYALGWIAAALTGNQLHQFFLAEDTMLAKAELELDMLALINVLALFAVGSWLVNEWRQAGLLTWPKASSFLPKVKVL